jgi:co-chaperonin GroES (HSP10)
MKITPIGDKVLIKIVDEGFPQGEIFIPETIAAFTTRRIYEVVAVGPKCRDVSVGDKVGLTRINTPPVEIDGVKHGFVRETEIIHKQEN